MQTKIRSLLESFIKCSVFGTWPVVMVSANRRRVVVEGPVCSSSRVVGWQLKDLNKGTENARTPMFSREASNGTAEMKTARINISGFAFNSSILWDPERWGRPSSVLDTSQVNISSLLWFLFNWQIVNWWSFDEFRIVTEKIEIFTSRLCWWHDSCAS